MSSTADPTTSTTKNYDALVTERLAAIKAERFARADSDTLEPQLYTHNDHDRHERACEQLSGFADLAQTYRNMQSLICELRDRDQAHFRELAAQMADALVRAFPTPDAISDELLDTQGFRIVPAEDES